MQQEMTPYDLRVEAHATTRAFERSVHAQLRRGANVCQLDQTLLAERQSTESRFLRAMLADMARRANGLHHAAGNIHAGLWRSKP